MIERPSIIVTSLGRTGTTFFARLFGQIIPQCNSFHEPDVVQYFGTDDRMESFVRKLRDAGPYDMLFMKAIGRWNLIRLSDARLRGSLDDARGVKEILRQRTHFVNSKTGRVYVESSGTYYGLIDLLKDVYRCHRAIYVVRDGRDWVSSTLQVKEFYGKTGLRRVLSHKMPAASEFPDDPLSATWDSTSRFEKLCWAWAKLNAYALSTLAKNPHARLYRFENIFLAQDKYDHLKDLVSFCTTLPGIEPGQLGSLDGFLERKVNPSQNAAEDWKKWSREQKRQFEQLCGPLMEKLGYDL